MSLSSQFRGLGSSYTQDEKEEEPAHLEVETTERLWKSWAEGAVYLLPEQSRNFVRMRSMQSNRGRTGWAVRAPFCNSPNRIDVPCFVD